MRASSAPLSAQDLIAGVVAGVAGLQRPPKPEVLRALLEGLGLRPVAAAPAPVAMSPAPAKRKAKAEPCTACTRRPRDAGFKSCGPCRQKATAYGKAKRDRDARAQPPAGAAGAAAQPLAQRTAARAKRSTPSPAASPAADDDSGEPPGAVAEASRSVAESSSAPRKCNPLPRARTLNTEELRSLVRREDHITAWEISRAQLERPKTRGECKDGPRPCPWISCRHHLATDVNPDNGSLKGLYSHLRIIEEPEGEGLQRLEETVGTCSLDVADRADPAFTWPADQPRPDFLKPGVGGLLRLRQVAESGHPIGQTDGMELKQVAEVFGQSHEQIRDIGSTGLQNVRCALRREDNARVPRALVVLQDPAE